MAPARSSPAARTRPHRPYEGSQHDHEGCALTLPGGPHRPYEGSQRGDAGAVAVGADVLIAPTRGRNCCWSATLRWLGLRPHRPYEGSQPPDTGGARVVHVPPHRPYEGMEAFWGRWRRGLPRGQILKTNPLGYLGTAGGHSFGRPLTRGSRHGTSVQRCCVKAVSSTAKAARNATAQGLLEWGRSTPRSFRSSAVGTR